MYDNRLNVLVERNNMDSKEKKVAPETNEIKKQSSSEFIAYLFKYFKENPIISLSALSFVLGNTILVFFFFKIGFMPDLNLESITSILYGITILSILFIVYFLFCLIFPGLFLSCSKDEISGVKIGHLICLIIAASILAFLFISFLMGLPKIISLGYFYYFLGGIGAVNFFLLGIWYSCGNLTLINKYQFIKIKNIYPYLKKAKSQKSNKYLFLKIFFFFSLIILINFASNILSIITIISLGFVILPILPILFSRINFKQVGNTQNSKAKTPQQTHNIKNNNKVSDSFKIFWWSVCTTSMATILITGSAMIFCLVWLSGDISNETNNSIFLKLFLLVLISTICSVFIVIAKYNKQILYALFICFLLLFPILMAIDKLANVIFMGIRVLQLGEINSARITVTKETCQEINQTLGKKVCNSQSLEPRVPICPVIIKSRIGNQAVLEFAHLDEIKSEEKNATDNKSNNSKNFYWITTKKADNSDENIRITQVVILDKSKINSWQTLARIKEKDFKDIKKTSSEQNTASPSSASEPTAHSADNDILKLVTLYDAKQKISAGTASDVDEFLLKHCREDTDEFTNKNPATNK
jgi:hypothetical protein